VSFDLSQRSAVLDRVLSLLNPIPFDEGCRVYLRGGILEECVPHAQADVDLVVVGPRAQSTDVAEAICERLAALDRPIEAVPIEEADLQRVAQLRMLIQFRSLQLHGASLGLPPLEVNDALIDGLWRVYSPSLLADTLEGHLRHRLVTLKYLLRAVGILGLSEGCYSRDLRTCLAWSQRYVPASFGVLAQGFDDLDRDRPPPLNIGPVILDLEAARSSLL